MWTTANLLYCSGGALILGAVLGYWFAHSRKDQTRDEHGRWKKRS